MRENEELVLDYINSVRKTFNLGDSLDELPPDYEGPEDVTCNCPVAVALTKTCGYGCVTIDELTVRMPWFVSRFQVEHDHRTRDARQAAVRAFWATGR